MAGKINIICCDNKLLPKIVCANMNKRGGIEYGRRQI